MLTSVPTVTGSIEDATAHWGVRTQLGPSGTSCPLCRLSILSPVSDLQPGVVVLRCGEHALVIFDHSKEVWGKRLKLDQVNV